MKDNVLKVTVEHGAENDFMKFCIAHGIYYRQYPSPITWAFRVEESGTVSTEYKLSLLSYVKKIEPMPTVELSNK